MADLLPECLIHKILSRLSLAEAAPSMILSKTWLQAWFTNPVLRLATKSVEDTKQVDKIMDTYRQTKNPIHKFEFTIQERYYTTKFEFRCLIDKWVGIAVQNGVNVMVWKSPYMKYCELLCTLPIFTILGANSLTELVVEGFDLPTTPSLSSTGVVNCYSLINLSLTNVRLNDSMLQTLLTCCPLIVTLFLKHCIDLENIELRNLQKIKSVSINGYDDHICRIAHYIHLVDIVECHSLISLELSLVRISYGLLEHVILTCQSLESLILGYLDNENAESEKLLIKSQSLRTLKISDSTGEIVIDAPNLNLIEYKGQGHIPELKMPKESNQLKHLTLDFSFKRTFDVAWFCELRNFLSNSASLSRVSLCLNFRTYCSSINGEELQQSYHRVATSQVDVLDVKIPSYGKYNESLVDALLWSCHPRRLNLLSVRVKTMTCFMDRLMHMKNSADSSASGSKHWYSRLKQVKAYKFDWQKPVEFTNAWSLREQEKVYFLLDW